MYFIAVLYKFYDFLGHILWYRIFLCVGNFFSFAYFFVQMVAPLAHARVNNYYNGPMQFPTLQIISGLSNCPTTTAVCVVQKVLSDCLGTYATASRQLELAKLKYFSFHVN